MSFRGIASQARLQFINHLSNTFTVKHKHTMVVVEVAPNKNVSLAFEEIYIAPPIKNEVNAVFHRRQTQIQNQVNTTFEKCQTQIQSQIQIQ